MRRYWLSMLLAAVLLFSGCDMPPGSPAGEEGKSAYGDAEPAQDNRKVRILASYDEQKQVTDSFRRLHPETEVEWIKARSDVFLDILASENPPDIIIMDNGMIAEVNAMDVFEDLSRPPYEAETRHAGFPGLKLDGFRSLDGSRLIAVPKDFPMALTFYREDILAGYGYPVEPEALAAYLEDPRRWLDMAAGLRAAGHWIFNTPGDPVYVAATGRSFFGPDRQYQRSGPMMAEAAEMARTVEKSGLARKLNIWDENGREAIRKGEIVMLFMGEWAANLLKEWDPEHAAQWRMTRLPLGVYGSQGGASFLISKYSRSKQASWDYIQHSMKEEAPYLESLKGREYYDRVPPAWVTPLDSRAHEVWDKQFYDSLAAGRTAAEILSDQEIKVTSTLSKELQIMYEMLEE
ncbi:family 1 extracellular solute-binding protein [Paenibacillus mucilaginosus 3016]|uniref:Family 1 extracellular solute-binding protein n=1 Tax=Paenibacillus mucilaginosus 3016 TaxID=1116391 RepID=H6NH15_9BACL|nr:extracellular solute-binding protein [Paenibacillus mucilaginosus]AFC28693.1 family 1 extracellular solute-binding protein [Paenibacillus mucilaginosus 3016]WFA17471.1 extracellular solute-binding protein [Paenibacillus mucilaginosus]